ncbi:MAG: hypothetical protein L6R41_003908 [Letrouitia leprolyta]|nr:MAG: hypothetical protein L6R41_003908 [Letrouitia leprolyta]
MPAHSDLKTATMYFTTVYELLCLIEETLDPPIVPPTHQGIQRVFAWMVRNFDTLLEYHRPYVFLQTSKGGYSDDRRGLTGVDVPMLICVALEVIGDWMQGKKGAAEKGALENGSHRDHHRELLSGLRQAFEWLSEPHEDDSYGSDFTVKGD